MPEAQPRKAPGKGCEESIWRCSSGKPEPKTTLDTLDSRSFSASDGPAAASQGLEFKHETSEKEPAESTFHGYT